MSRCCNWRRTAALAVVLLVATAGLASAQLTTGNIFVTVTETGGQPLPGATVTVSGIGAPQVQHSGAAGQVRFLGLAPGNYRVEASLDGFSTVVFEAANVRVGQNTALELRLSPAVEEVITVTAESPLLDERRVTAGQTVTQVELEKIPTSRDPWVILQSTPGVLVDRVNVGGSEAGEQSNFVGPGSGRLSASWAMDGVVVTDPAARGASPSYFDFDTFEEMQIGTGGSDITAMTPGVQINLVTKRGTNEWRGSARYLLTDEKWQSSPDVSSGDLGRGGPWNAGAGQPEGIFANTVDKVEDFGAELGGPVLQDRLWFWGSYGTTEVKKFALGGVPDDTQLPTYAAKINAQLGSSNSLVAFYHHGDKQKQGRGASASRPRETTWNQTGPSPIYKLEDTHVFTSNLYLTGMVSKVEGGFTLAPIGGLDVGNIAVDEGGVWRNSFFHHSTERPQEQARLDGSYFFTTGNLNHELKFGVGYRHNEVTSFSLHPGNGTVGFLDTPLAPGIYYAVAYHDWLSGSEFTQYHLLVQDTIAMGRLTANVGLRYDTQRDAEVLSTTQSPSPAMPDLMPAFTRPGAPAGFSWNTLSPRLGLTYALGEERRTLLRGSYARFAEGMGTGFFSFLGPTFSTFAGFEWHNFNGDTFITPNEIGPVFRPPATRGDFPAHSVDPSFNPPLTDELLLGLEHALRPEFVVGVNLTYRRITDLDQRDPYVIADGVRRVAQRGDFVEAGRMVGTLPNGQTYSVPVFGLRTGVTFDPARGTHMYNGDVEQEAYGISTTFNKRLANRWMLRGHVSYGGGEWDVPAGAFPDPTPGLGFTTGGSGAVNGHQVLHQSAGSGNRGEVWLHSKWSANLAGMYQVAPDRPWGFNVAADLNGRQGFPAVYRRTVTAAQVGDGLANRQVLLAPESDSVRMDNLYQLNLRVEKEFRFQDVGLTLGVDAFNALNAGTVLQREAQIATTFERQAYREGVAAQNFTLANARGDFVRETVVPRIFRVGARVSFR